MNLIGVVSTKCLKKEWVIAIQQCYSYYTFESMAKKLKEDPSWKKGKSNWHSSSPAKAQVDQNCTEQYMLAQNPCSISNYTTRISKYMDYFANILL